MAYLNSFDYNSFDRSKPPFQQPSSYIPFSKPIEEQSDWEKKIKINEDFERWIHKVEDSWSIQRSQTLNPYLIQNQNDYIHYLDRLEAQLDRLENIENVRTEETLSNTFLTIFYSPSLTDDTDELWCLEDLDQNSISSHQRELDQS